MRDLHNNMKAIRTIAPVSLGATAAGGIVGKVVDRRGFRSVEFVLGYGSITATNATITPVVKHGDATGAMTSVADDYLLGTEAAAGIAAGTPRTSNSNKNVTKRLGYIGNKRYVQVNLVPTISGAMIASAQVILGNPAIAPVAT